MAEQYIDVTHRSSPGTQVAKQVNASITAATAADPVVVTAVNDFSNGDIVQADGVGGMTELNDISYTVANRTATTLELSGIDGGAFTTYTTGGTLRKLMEVTGDVRVLYDDTLKGDRLVNAVQRAKEALTESL